MLIRWSCFMLLKFEALATAKCLHTLHKFEVWTYRGVKP
uniref:Uncharacterized protein n=1 Tax=Anguilla anguilla TaxID=7936 RepID=A0A0E9XCF3_ANGAN